MIRKADKNDMDNVVRIWYETNLSAHSFIPGQYWSSQFEAVKEMLPLAELYVYDQAGKVTGFVGLDGDYIAGIFVDSNAQSNGIGRQLLEYTKALKAELSLNVYQKNERAVRFYQREGFVIQSEGVDEITGEKEYSMLWTLPHEKV